MTELHVIQQLLSANSSVIEARYLQHAPQTDEVSPMQLTEALQQLLQVFETLDRTHGAQGALPYDDASELGEHGTYLVADLSRWAERLELPQVKFEIEKIAVGIALWVANHDGEIRELETVVNGFAANANSTNDEEGLRELFHAAQKVLAHVSPQIEADVDQSNPGRPWRVLNFNCAIIATRTQDAQLMREAFDTLSRNLPQDAPAFFEEGLKQSDKPVYGPTVKNLMQEYFTRWTVRH